MSARDQMRAALDELMGTARNGGSAIPLVQYDDPKVCKPFLLGCCPNEILASTRVDLGECSKTHDLALKADYEKARETRKDLNYEYIALDILENFVEDCDKRKEASKRKLKETQEDLSEEAAKKMNIINELGEQIGTKLAKAEELGNTGHVDDSIKLLEEVEELKKKKGELEYEFRNSMPASTYQQQKLRVCEVCSAYLGIHDNDRRLADHFGGKLHLGFIHIREKLDELRERVKEIRKIRDERRLKDDSHRNRRSSRERDRVGDRGVDRGRDRRRSRSRSRSNSRYKSSRHYRNRSRSRSHHKSSSHRKRSDSRSKKRNARSRSRSSSRTKRHHHKHHRHSSNSRKSSSHHSKKSPNGSIDSTHSSSTASPKNKESTTTITPTTTIPTTATTNNENNGVKLSDETKTE